MKALKSKKLILGTLSILILALGAVFLFCELTSSERLINARKKAIRKPEVQAYIENWVNQYVVSNSAWRATGLRHLSELSEDGFTEYRDVSIFDWSIIGGDDPAPIMVEGKSSDPCGVLFYGAGRTAIIYSFGQHPTEFHRYRQSFSNDFTKITDHIYFFDLDTDNSR